jgi:hypothetical protein
VASNQNIGIRWRWRRCSQKSCINVATYERNGGKAMTTVLVGIVLMAAVFMLSTAIVERWK